MNLVFEQILLFGIELINRPKFGRSGTGVIKIRYFTAPITKISDQSTQFSRKMVTGLKLTD